jgi:hypothetical protein
MKTKNYVEQNGIERGIDFDAHYRVAGWPAVAFVLLGWSGEWEPTMCLCTDDEGHEWEEPSDDGEGEWIADYSTVVAVMVGDDRRHDVDVSDLELISEDGFCRDCGQVGCRCNVYA